MAAQQQPGTPTDVAHAPMCDREGVGSSKCDQHAVLAYQFDWGEKGVCCAKHGFLLQQIADQIGRTIQLIPLMATPTPLTRDERTQLKASALVAEEELNEAKARGLDLYRSNTKLLTENQTLRVRDKEMQAQLRDRDGVIQQLSERLQKAESEHADLVQEVDRLRTLESLLDSETSTVDGGS